MDNYDKFVFELLAYCKDHVENFGVLPVEFEFENKLYDTAPFIGACVTMFFGD